MAAIVTRSGRIIARVRVEEGAPPGVIFTTFHFAEAPDAYEAKVLDEFAALKAKGELQVDSEHAEVVTEDGQRNLRYMKPILVGSPVCLSCHGGPQDISPEVKAHRRSKHS